MLSQARNINFRLPSLTVRMTDGTGTHNGRLMPKTPRGVEENPEIGAFAWRYTRRKRRVRAKVY